MPALADSIFGPLHALFCDDIRREENGKHILIGVYSGKMLVPSFPWAQPMAVYLQTPTKKKGHVQFRFRVMLEPTEMKVMEIEGTMESAAPDSGNAISLGGFVVQAQTAGALRVDASMNGASWEEVARLEIIIPSDNSNASQQPS